MKGFMEEYRRWLDNPELDPVLGEELTAIAGDTGKIEERFYRELEFGTAGLRGVIGAGTNRMNLHVVRRATQGLAGYLNACPGARERGVAIAYDSRHMSPEFAKETALVLAQNGIKAYLFESLRPVPLLSFTVLRLHCIAGVVVTASHNPPAYNGYKVYWEHGGQAGPEQAEEILSHIRRWDYFGVSAMDEETAKAQGLLVMLGDEINQAYYESTQTLLLHPQLLKEKGSGLKLVYTPLHGSGNVPVNALLERVGVSNVSVVEAQRQPDGDFPTVAAPNPEDPNAFTLAFALANQVGADVILATDPDADRLGAAVRRHDGEFSVLTGNQIGSILIHYLLSSMAGAGTLPANGLVVKSLVSTRMADAICARYGVEIQDVLTGFRFISEKIDRCKRTGEHTFLFGFEESFGFLAGTFSRDKDAVCAAMLLAEACVYYMEQGMTLYDLLLAMYETYGYYKEGVKSYTLGGKEGMEKIAGAMAALRSAPPPAFAGIPVEYAEDFTKDLRLCAATGKAVPIGLPRSDVLRYFLAGGAWICVRPSGTEPKLKLYVGANSRDEAELDSLLAALTADCDRLLQGYLS